MKDLFAFLKPKRIMCFFSLLLSVVTAVLGLMVPVYFGNAIDCLGNMKEIVKPLTFCAGVVVTVAILQLLTGLINNRISIDVVTDMRAKVFGKLQRLPVSTHDSKMSGELVSLLISDIDTISEGLLLGFSQGLTGFITIIGTIYYMWRINVLTTLIVVLVTPLSLFVAKYIAQSTHDRFVKQSELRAVETGLIDEVLGENETVLALNYEKKAMERFRIINRDLGKVSLGAIFMSSTVNPSTRFVNAIVYGLVAGFAGMRVMKGDITIGALTALLSYATQYTKPFNEISGVVTELQNARACSERVFKLLREPEIELCPCQTNEKEIFVRESDDSSLQDTKKALSLKGSVEIKNGCFSYTGDKKLIENLNLEAKSGMKIAIVGPTGCGKTTIINLLMGFYLLDEGSILFDGMDLRELNTGELRKNIGMVLQDTWIKAGTVEENIRLGRENATIDEIEEVCRECRAHSFIMRLPQGYKTVLGEGGNGLSDGQKQLLCIARVMIKNPSILILDEATSNIDTRTELKIKDALDRLMEGRTSFVVAHRLSTIINSDMILAMRDGKILEQGNHSQLMDRKGFYYELFNAQFPLAT